MLTTKIEVKKKTRAERREEYLNTLSPEDRNLKQKHEEYINSPEFKIPLQKLINNSFRKFAYGRPENIFYPRQYQEKMKIRKYAD